MQSEIAGGVSPHAGLSRIKPHMVTENSADTTETIIDIASNESAYGPSPIAAEAARQSAADMNRYAIDAVRDLTARIAEFHGIRADGIVCGHGSDDLLLRIAQTFLQPGDELVCNINGYQRIPNFAHTANAHPVKASDRNFTTDVDRILDCVTERTRIVMLANPDNPTGTFVRGTEIRRLQASLPSFVLLVLDSAYLEYVSTDEFENPATLIEESENVVMTRTFSKIYGLAGLRLGWMYASPAVADAVRKMGMTFPLSNVAYQAGLAALGDQSHVKSAYEQNLKVRDEFSIGLEKLGLEVIPSQTNFVLVRFRQPDYCAESTYQYLRSRGILARRLASDAFSEYVRFTLGLPEQMNQVLDQLHAYFESQNVHTHTVNQ